MAYWLRRDDGTFDSASSGTVIYPDGSTKYLSKDDMEIEILEHWKSEVSGARYPSRWNLKILPLNMQMQISTQVPNQELVTTKSTQVTYWEGAVNISGRFGKFPTEGGWGYVELTGYAEPFDPGN